MRGWPLVGWTALVVGMAVALALLGDGDLERRSRLALRLTAFSSGVLFSAVFAASPLRRLAPSAATRWLVANRRYLGVSFAVSHGYHLLAIVLLIRAAGSAERASIDPVTTIGGSLGYAFVLAMVATSFDRTAAWLGRRAWGALHGTGLYFLWFVFAMNYGLQMMRSPVHFLVAALVIAGAVLRVAAWWKARVG